MKSRDEQAQPIRMERFFPQDTALTIDDYQAERVPWPEPATVPWWSTPLPAGPDVGWRRSANCRDTTPGLFFPDADNHYGRSASVQQTVVAAKAVCSGCSVRSECLDFAVTSGEQHGIWGGMTGRERRRLSTRSRAATGGAA